MTESFLTPANKRLLRWLRLFLGLLGILWLLLGGGRVALELLGGISALAETFSPALFSTRTLILGILHAGVGYLALYSMAAVGAVEPPALNATRYSLLSIALLAWITVVWAAFVSLSYALGALLVAGALNLACFGLWRTVVNRQLWQVFGQRVVRRRGSNRLLYAVGSLSLLILAALGVIYAILTDTLELPPSSPQAGALLYATTFDNFNDEWDLPRGRQSAEVVGGELVLTEASGIPDSVFYARLDSRKFGDFDLRVQTRQVGGDNDNSYGVIFRWRDFDNFYRFEISGDGFYRLSKTEDGHTETVTQWIPSTVIHTGNAANEIRIVAQDDRFRFYINQVNVPLCTRGKNREPLIHPLTGECISNTWQDEYIDDAFRQGKIGLAVGTTQTTDITQPVVVAFDNLVLIGPD